MAEWENIATLLAFNVKIENFIAAKSSNVTILVGKTSWRSGSALQNGGFGTVGSLRFALK